MTRPSSGSGDRVTRPSRTMRSMVRTRVGGSIATTPGQLCLGRPIPSPEKEQDRPLADADTRRPQLDRRARGPSAVPRGSRGSRGCPRLRRPVRRPQSPPLAIDHGDAAALGPTTCSSGGESRPGAGQSRRSRRSVTPGAGPGGRPPGPSSASTDSGWTNRMLLAAPADLSSTSRDQVAIPIDVGTECQRDDEAVARPARSHGRRVRPTGPAPVVEDHGEDRVPALAGQRTSEATRPARKTPQDAAETRPGIRRHGRFVPIDLVRVNAHVKTP